MFLLFEGFQSQNVAILYLYSTKHSYMLTTKIILTLVILANWYWGTQLTRRRFMVYKTSLRRRRRHIDVL